MWQVERDVGRIREQWNREREAGGWGLGLPLRGPQGLSQATHHQHQHSRARVCMGAERDVNPADSAVRGMKVAVVYAASSISSIHSFSCHRSHYATIIPRRVNVITGNALVKLIPHY